MPDGSRRRRQSLDMAKRRWYAQHRSRRFARRFGFGEPPKAPQNTDSSSALYACGA
jgi:hypothetical protein